ncbi:MAG TPA: AtpZ/AtpI family protein [Candidatus Polarisedimenticolaceae bacterium]|nr:AtpZ/AtpI family protein [Candidatus Polarisedimenticolaceae bacterium]
MSRESGGTRRKSLAPVGIGLEMAVPIALFVYVGYRLDRWMGSEPWFALGGTVLGMTIAFYNLYRRVRG